MNSYAYVGVDPDLHSTAFAVITSDAPRLRVEAVRIARVDQKHKLLDAAALMALEIAVVGPLSMLLVHAAIEAPQHYGGARGGTKTRHANPEDLIALAVVSGAAAGFYSQNAEDVELVTPSVWKGQVPKGIHQAATCARLGWTFDPKKDFVLPHQTCGIKDLERDGGLRPGDWKHALDAIGLALWAMEKHERAARLASY